MRSPPYSRSEDPHRQILAPRCAVRARVAPLRSLSLRQCLCHAENAVPGPIRNCGGRGGTIAREELVASTLWALWRRWRRWRARVIPRPTDWQRSRRWLPTVCVEICVMRMHRLNSGGDDEGGSEHNRAYYSAHRFEHFGQAPLLKSGRRLAFTRRHAAARLARGSNASASCRQRSRDVVCQRVESMLRGGRSCTAKNPQNGQRPYRQRRPPASDCFSGGASTAISRWFRLLYEGGRLSSDSSGVGLWQGKRRPLGLRLGKNANHPIA